MPYEEGELTLFIKRLISDIQEPQLVPDFSLMPNLHPLPEVQHLSATASV